MAPKIQTYIRTMDAVSETTGTIAAWMFFTTGIIVSFEVCMRYVLNSPTIWVDEMSRFFRSGPPIWRLAMC